MKKLIFRKLAKDTIGFFLLSSISMAIIVWIIQAVNYLDFISEDGHSFKVYFMFTILNLPKIFSKILPFMFFVSLFYTLSKYEEKNELIIFWVNGINKAQFLRNIFSLSMLFVLLQITLTTIIVPNSQDLARSYIRTSTMDFFPNILKEKKFIDTVSDLTIYVDQESEAGILTNIFLKDNTKSKNESKIIYARNGELVRDNNNFYLILNDGQIIENKDNSTKVFSFDSTKFSLTRFSSKTTTFPKIKEIKTADLIECIVMLYLKKTELIIKEYLQCNKKTQAPVISETFARFYLPFYLPILGLVVSFLILTSKDQFKYKRFKYTIFIVSILIIILSEVSLRFSGISYNKNVIFFSIPIILLFLILVIYQRKLKFNK